MKLSEYIKVNNIPHKIDKDGYVIQDDILVLNNKGITSLEDFKQTAPLDLSNNEITNSKDVFINPATNRVVIKYKSQYSCGCFIGNEEDFIEKCLEKNFIEVLKHFNLIITK